MKKGKDLLKIRASVGAERRTNMSEVWKDVKNYERFYQVSNLGNVRSIDRYVKAKNNSQKLMKSKILKQITNDRGYRMVDLSKNAKKRKIFVHILVAEAFIENFNDLPQINHKNEIKDDNRVENLEWCTNLYNCNYGTRNQKIKEKKNVK